MTGDGCKEFFDAINDACHEYEHVYKVEYNKWQEKKVKRENNKREKDLKRLKDDLDTEQSVIGEKRIRYDEIYKDDESDDDGGDGDDEPDDESRRHEWDTRDVPATVWCWWDADVGSAAWPSQSFLHIQLQPRQLRTRSVGEPVSAIPHRQPSEQRRCSPKLTTDVVFFHLPYHTLVFAT